MKDCGEGSSLISNYAICARRYSDAAAKLGLFGAAETFDVAYDAAEEALRDVQQARILLNEYLTKHRPAAIKSFAATPDRSPQ